MPNRLKLCTCKKLQMPIGNFRLDPLIWHSQDKTL